MKNIAYAAFGIGVMLSISGAAKMPVEGSDYPDTVPVFLAGAILAIIGVTLWRIALGQEKKADAKDSGSETKEQGSPDALLNDLIEPLNKLRDDIAELDADKIMARVDELLETYVLPFAEVRQRLINRLGMSAGAEVLVHIAYGERMLNRVWSAASDGHLPEARNCLPEAADAFVEAQQTLSKAS